MIQKKIYDKIIVGGGIAGLTSAAYIARAGKKVLLIEQNKECGGLVNTFKQNGFVFDAGVRALESAGVILPMLNDLGIKLDYVRSKVSVGIENEIINIEDINSLTDYRNLLVKFYPESEKEIDVLLKVIKKVMKHMEILYGLENPTFKDLKNDREFLFKKLLPWLPKFIFTIGKINKMNMPVEGYLASIITNPSLRDIISQHFFKNTPTFFALSYFSLYLDYFYPKGGVGKITELLVQKILELGGEIKTEVKIIKVLPNSKSLFDNQDNEYFYDNLIWAADLKSFYNITQTEGLSDKIKAKFENTKVKMLNTRGSDSVFSLFLQIDEPLESFRKIANGHFFYTPSKVGLGDLHRAQLNNLLSNWSNVDKKQVFEWLDKFTKLNTYEISIPGLKDDDLAPKGKTGMIISILMEYDLFKTIKETDWYEEFVNKLEENIIDVISASVFPILKGKIMNKFSYSPLSYAKRVSSSEGAIVGWTFEKTVPVISKIQLVNKSVSTPIPSVFQAGQWAYSPAGVPMSILTGKLAADKAIKN